MENLACALDKQSSEKLLRSFSLRARVAFRFCMWAVRAEQLAEERRALIHDIKQLDLAIKKEQLAVKRANSEWVFPESVVSDALGIFVLCGWARQPVRKFLRLHGSRQRWQPAADCFLDKLIDEAFLNCDLDFLVNAEPICSRALDIIKEWGVAQWVLDANAKRGVAPSTAQLLDKVVEQGASSAVSVRMKSTTGRPSASARKWATRCLSFCGAAVLDSICARFRKRWGGRIGTIKVKPDIKPELKRAKVRLCVMFW